MSRNGALCLTPRHSFKGESVRLGAQGLVRVTVRIPASLAAGYAVSQSKGYKAHGHKNNLVAMLNTSSCVLAFRQHKAKNNSKN
jgi:hypothetical protein